MKRLLLPLLTAFVLPNAVYAKINKETAEFCLKATDFAGCVETMSKDSLPPMQKILLMRDFVHGLETLE